MDPTMGLDAMDYQNERPNKSWGNAFDDRNDLIKTRESQVEALRNDVQLLKEECLRRNSANADMIAEFRDSLTAECAEVQTGIPDFEKRMDQMAQKLDDYQLESKGKWISFKHEYRYQMNELDKEVRNLMIKRG